MRWSMAPRSLHPKGWGDVFKSTEHQPGRVKMGMFIFHLLSAEQCAGHHLHQWSSFFLHKTTWVSQYMSFPRKVLSNQCPVGSQLEHSPTRGVSFWLKVLRKALLWGGAGALVAAGGLVSSVSRATLLSLCEHSSLLVCLGWEGNVPCTAEPAMTFALNGSEWI